MSLLENANTLSALLSKSQGWLQENGHWKHLMIYESKCNLRKSQIIFTVKAYVCFFGPSQVGRASNALSDGNEI